MTDPNKRIAIVCGTCGSDDISRDALAEWSIDTQQWELRDVLDNADCNRCERSTRLIEVDLASAS